MTGRRSNDDGVATVEFALLIGVLFGLVALAWPLGQSFADKLSLDRSMNDVVRFATATPNTPAYDPDDPSGAGETRRPTCQQVVSEVYRSLGISGNAAAEANISIPSFTCPDQLSPGQTFSITVQQTSNLGPLGDLLSMAGITHSSTVTVSAAASGREE